MAINKMVADDVVTTNADVPTVTTTHGSDIYLEELNWKLIREYIPVITFLVLHIIIGITGNSLACLFYGFKTPRTCNSVFIASLAAIDLCVCISSIASLVDSFINVYFGDSFACMISYFISHANNSASIIMLVVITMDRYRKICMPLAKQFALKRTARIVIIVIVVSVTYAARDFILIKTVEVDMINSNGTVTTIHYCSHTDDPSLATVVLVSHILDAVVAGTAIIGFFVFYSMILYQLIQHKQTMIAAKDEISSARKRIKSLKNLINNNIFVVEDEQIRQSKQSPVDAQGSAHSVDRMFTCSKVRNNTISTAERNITYTMLIITIGFVGSLLPYFISVVDIRARVHTQESEFTYGPQLMFRLYMLNSTINPFVYGFFNTQFRTFLFRTFCCCKQE